MRELRGKSVRLFLAEGTASGLTTAEIMNWTGHVLTGSRSRLPAFLERSERKRTGVYFLVGPDPQDPETLQVYIGEGDIVRKRIREHDTDKSKDFWERTCVITSKDLNITKAHARYLEARLIEIAHASGNASIANGTAPSPPQLPEADKSDMEFFIEQIKLILPVLGFDLLQQSKPVAKIDSDTASTPTDTGNTPVFQLFNDKLGIKARAREIGGEFVVLKDSYARAWVADYAHSYRSLQSRLIKSGKLVVEESNRIRFAEDVVFRSPSAAATTVYGLPYNGRAHWRTELGCSYGKWKTKQVDKAVSDTGSEMMEG